MSLFKAKTAEETKLLLEQGRNPNEANEHGFIPLMNAGTNDQT